MSIKLKDNRQIALSELKETTLERSNRRLQAQIKKLQSDREEMLALRADNEILKTQIAQINELLMGTANLAIR